MAFSLPIFPFLCDLAAWREAEFYLPVAGFHGLVDFAFVIQFLTFTAVMTPVGMASTRKCLISENPSSSNH